MRPDQAIEAAIAALKAGQIIHLPTETVYGLAGRADDAGVVAAIFAAKGRPRFNPLIAHVASIDMAREIAVFDRRAEALAKAFWPGPLTLILGHRGGVCDLARAGLDSVAVRFPAHEMARAVIAGVGVPVVAPSANRSGRPSPTCWADAVSETGSAVAISLDGGACVHGVESSVVSLMGDRPALLRPGSLSRAGIEALTGPLDDSPEDQHRSPGRLTRHYAPQAPLQINIDSPPPEAVYIAFGPSDHTGPLIQLSQGRDLSEAARHLFSALRQADSFDPSLICVAPVPDEGLGEAINDRLRRAAGLIG